MTELYMGGGEEKGIIKIMKERLLSYRDECILSLKFSFVLLLSQSWLSWEQTLLC